MTLLTKTIRRQLPQEFDRRNWVVEVHPWGLRFRAKRCKQTFDCTWGQAWNKAQMNHVEQVRPAEEGSTESEIRRMNHPEEVKALMLGESQKAELVTESSIQKEQHMAKKAKYLTWTVKFSVHEDWVADGFDLDDERALAMLRSDLTWAHEHELKAKVTTSPKESLVLSLQGYDAQASVAKLQETNSKKRRA